MAGVVIALWYADIRQKAENRMQWWLLTFVGVISILAGLFIRSATEGISKIRSTPSWVFICVGIGILSFQLAIYLIDTKSKQNWFSIIKPAGTSTLTSYLLPYFLYSFMALVHFKYPQFLSTGIGGFLRSVAIAFIIVIITGILEKRHVRLKI
jgi:predicted acyltransferase